ncbi:hypothetical protein BHE74_00035510 [Ensete ventricosum]|nr:hypothetical protein BHE74_00035510 [Ensete ventricosum]RZS01110.1 hypothetical protein BHM03_00030925 [Ensete ventricosum]
MTPTRQLASSALHASLPQLRTLFRHARDRGSRIKMEASTAPPSRPTVPPIPHGPVLERKTAMRPTQRKVALTFAVEDGVRPMDVD